MKSAGSAFAQPATVTGFTSGDEKIADRISVSTATATTAITSSLTRS